MSSKTNVARPQSRSTPAPAIPRGSRLPAPDRALWLLRILVLVCVGLTFARPMLLGWAAHHTYASTQANSGTGLLSRLIAAEDGADDEVVLLLVLVASVLQEPVIGLAFWWTAMVGLCAMAAEAALAGACMAVQAQQLRRLPRSYLLLRAQAPSGSPSSGRTGGASATGDEFYRALQLAIPEGTWWARLAGRAPWVALTLTGLPDRPAEIGFIVADANGQRRADTVMRIRTTIQGQSPGAQVDEVPDPLTAAVSPGVLIAWREYGLRLPSHYPLRLLDDIEGSDLLAPLAAALAPHGVLRTEAQIIVRPANRWALNLGWRGRATALLLGLQARADYALSEDAKRLEAKLDAAPFEVTIRIVAIAAGDGAQSQCAAALSHVEGALGQYAQRTSHHLQTLVPLGDHQARLSGAERLIALARAPGFAPPPAGLLPLRPWREADILTSLEIAGLWHLPGAGLGYHVRWLNCKVLPAPAEAFARGEAGRVVLGHARHADGSIEAVGTTWRDLHQVLHVTAGMGAGKTRLLANICTQAIPLGFILLDGKGDDAGGSLAARMRHHIPLADESRVIIFDILDTAWPIGLNPLAGIDFAKPGAKDQALGQIMAIFARLDPGWAAAPGMQEYVLNAALLVFAGQEQPTLAHIKQALLDSRYRERLLKRCTNPEVRTFWEVEYPQHGERQKTSLHALMRRFARLLTSETTRYLVSQAVPRLSLGRVMEQKLIVLAPMPHQTLGTLAGAVGMLLIQAVVRAALMRPGDDQTRTTFPLVVDELQVFLGEEGNTDMETATTQLRGLGIAGVYAHQTISQLGTLENEMMTNSGSRVVLRTQEPDASTYARKYADKGITAADIVGQDPEEHQYAALLCHRTPTGIFSMITLGWPETTPVEMPVYAGPHWQTLLPIDSPDLGFDTAVRDLIYGTHQHPDVLAAELAQRSEAEWGRLLERWAAVRDHQLAYILANPGCIPDRLERQRWISRLTAATPVIVAEAEYLRIRREIAPERAMTTGNSPKLARVAAAVPSGGVLPVGEAAEVPALANLAGVDPERPARAVAFEDDLFDDADDY
jgi:hypothetical protein